MELLTEGAIEKPHEDMFVRRCSQESHYASQLSLEVLKTYAFGEIGMVSAFALPFLVGWIQFIQFWQHWRRQRRVNQLSRQLPGVSRPALRRCVPSPNSVKLFRKFLRNTLHPRAMLRQ